MLRVLAICLILFGTLSLRGQNLLDEEGRKTGHWKVEYPGGKTRYEGDFKDGLPVGEMVHYYEKGGVRARMVFEPESDRSLAHLYYENGKLAAEGFYEGQDKDSVWTYYSEFDGSIRLREPYVEGKLDGVARSYYPDGKVSEEVEWKQNVKEGSWIQYYKNGVTRLSGHLKDGKLDGPYEVFFSNEIPQIKGQYKQNKLDGKWLFYNEDGEEVYALDYINGLPADQEKYDSWIEDSLNKYLILTEPDSFQQP